ncbi:hypothetical protein OG563_38745 [Nocardia vinacea]|uniref:DUF732 domain-containing protein n=1 Tax=Nocardia vinacea TaxID=96468 RepID=A0ABZ1YP20_9NOCA|nr:hypothetical protein [Nocardia vinacea]
MPASTIALLVVAIAVAFVWWAAVYLLPCVADRDDSVPEGALPAAEILDRIAAEGTLCIDSWQLEPSHRAPEVPYTAEQAHAELQRHRECGTNLCAAKYEAFWTLVDAGHSVPDVRAVR